MRSVPLALGKLRLIPMRGVVVCRLEGRCRRNQAEARAVSRRVAKIIKDA